MLEVVNLRCEYKENPIGIDVTKPRFSWKLISNTRGIIQTAYQVQVSQDDSSFTNIVWDTGKIDSDQSIHIEYNGESLTSRTRYFFRVKVWDNKGNASNWSEAAFWEMGLLKAIDWCADWITPGFKSDKEYPDACPMLRKTFNLTGHVKAARVYTTSLGLYELHINGNRVGEDLFTPGWTSYNNWLQYQTYDITSMLTNGKNAIGITLGNGWYKGNIAWNDQKNTYGDTLAALLQLHVTYEDGKEEIIATDTSWKSSTGPILMSEIYHGEVYDGRLEKDGWSTVSYDDSAWSSVSSISHSKEILAAQVTDPVKKIESIRPIEIINTPLGETVIDFGQNMVGWVRFTVQGEAGSCVTLQHAEVLDKEGNFYTENLRAAKQTIKYILKGKGQETYEPHFTFQGFRYVKVEGHPGKLSLDNFTGIVIHSDMEQTGSFKCSDELVNQLQHNILWGQKGNFLDVPTDCPQRDERLGWTGDAQMFIRTACFNMNTASFFAKWLKDLKADQLENGGVPFVIPHVLDKNSHSSAAWGDAAAICPFTIYLCYGDKRILEEQYESMKSWVEYIRNQGTDEYLWNTGFHFGDWLALDAKEGSYIGATSKDYIATAFYAYSTSLLVKTAGLLGKTEDAKEYEKLYKNVLKAFNKEFITPNGRIAAPTQTAHVLALMFDLLEEKNRERAVKALIEYLEESKYHLTTGFVGTPYLCLVLSRYGYTDIAYKLLMQKDYPSWLYQVTKGATTIWEHWDGIKEDGSFWSKDMNSFNHYAYGSIGDWLYRVVTGIDIDENNPGYKHIYIKPQPNEALSFAEAAIESMYGEIKSSWTKTRDEIEILICIPPNTTATVILPSANLSILKESGDSISKADGINLYENIDSGVKLLIGSGNYKFNYPII